MYKRHFYSLKSLLFYKQHHKNTYLGPFQRKADSKEILNFWRKSWVNLFGKMKIRLERNFLIFDQNHGLTPFEKIFDYAKMTLILADCRSRVSHVERMWGTS